MSTMAMKVHPACLYRQSISLRLKTARNVALACRLQGGNISLEVPKREVVATAELSKAQLLWRAIKLPIYSVALVPLSVGSAVAFLESGTFDASQYCRLFVSSVLVITWLNLSNDAYDAETGVDKDKKESVVNITGSQRGVLLASYACLALGCAGLVRGAFVAADARVAYFLAAAIFCGYVYQCPPFRLSYKGVGEPLCFLAFGPLATTAFYLSQSHASLSRSLPIASAILGASVLVGVTTTLILFCSHFHQIDGDKAVGKLSPLVRLGTFKAAKIVELAVAGLYVAVSGLAAVRALPVSCALLCMMTFSLGKQVVSYISSYHNDKEKIFFAKYYCVRLHTVFNFALAMGLLYQGIAH